MARLRLSLREAGWEVPESPAPIVALFPTRAPQAQHLRRALQRAGIYPTWTHYPGRPQEGYLRLVLSPSHTAADVDRLLEALQQVPPPEPRRRASPR